MGELMRVSRDAVSPRLEGTNSLHSMLDQPSLVDLSPRHSKRRSRGSRRRNPLPETSAIGKTASPKSKSLTLKRLSLWRRKEADDRLVVFSQSVGNAGVDRSNKSAPNKNEDSSSGSHKRLRRPLSFLRGKENASISLDPPEVRKSRSKESKTSSVTEESDFEDKVECPSPSLAERTKIVTEIALSPSNSSSNRVEPIPEESLENEGRLTTLNCATAILGLNYMERICGNHRDASFNNNIHSRHYHDFPEDPTIQESIECIFASQLETGLNLWDDDEEETHPHVEPRDPTNHMISPSLLQQSRQNRCDRLATSLSQSKKRYEQASLVYVGTFDPTIAHTDHIADNHIDPLQCSCAHTCVPVLEPKDWPQAPVLLRPTPDKGTKVKGVRFGGSKDYFWEPGSHLSWSECLAQKWGKPCEPAPRVGCCERCAVLPINNGNESQDDSLVIDFESDLFVGSLLLRIRFTEGTTEEPYDDNKGYFKGVNRRYQAVIQGRFKKSIPFTELTTGFQFDRPCGKLPAKWILRGGIKVLSFFAPQLDAKMEGEKPHSLTPLGSTPQVICVDHDVAKEPIQGVHQEPPQGDRTLLGHSCQAPTSLQRARTRKKAFDKLFVHKSLEPRTDTSKIYTFEFLQHLFNFQDFSIELGNMLGSVELKEVLDGQPLQIMATHGDQRIWSFDIWHESLWETARLHERQKSAQ